MDGKRWQTGWSTRIIRSARVAVNDIWLRHFKPIATVANSAVMGRNRPIRLLDRLRSTLWITDEHEEAPSNASDFESHRMAFGYGVERGE